MTLLATAGAAIAVLLTGNLPWGPLISLNFRTAITWPWAVLPMTAWLAAWWMGISGRWFTGGEVRSGVRARLNAGPLLPLTWIAALAAGLVGFAAIIALIVLMARLVSLPDGAPITTPAGMPMLTGLVLLAMQSVVAGMTEEAAFRGYMQSMVARRHGIALAILAQGTLFGLLHAPNHPGAVLLMLPYYMFVSAVYGGLTWAAGSILPAIVLHAAGDTVVLARWWLTGVPEWQIGPVHPALVRQSGVDAAFIVSVLAWLLLTSASVAAFAAMQRWRTAGGRHV